ncbi:hypothetical protein [Lacinutrix sp.]|uniref:hypothetical protein n=1 Tax=Lacinutrix sp. TaxID=1937692 RepID=UPI0030ED0007
MVTNVDNQNYWVTFIDNGLEVIPLNEDVEVIEAADNEVDTVILFDIESSLVRI